MNDQHESVVFFAPVTIEIQRLKDLLTGAWEGGSNYWYSHLDSEVPKEERPQYWHIELPFVKGGPGVTFRDEEEGDTIYLDREKCLKGIEVMAKKYPLHFANFLEENDDADTSDVYLQCCVFGVVHYG